MPQPTYTEPARDLRVAGRADVVVVGGGPAGFSAAVAAARQGASVCLVERYPYLGGLASGGMVLVLDDMCAGAEITVRGICAGDGRPHARHAASRSIRRKRSAGTIRRCSANGRAGACSISTCAPGRTRSATRSPSIRTAGSAPATTWCRKPGSTCGCTAGSRAQIVRDGRVAGVVVESKAGREAILGDGGDRRDRRSRCRRHRRRRVFRRRLHGDHGVPPRRRRHRRSRTLPVRGTGALRRTRPRRPRRVIGGSWDYWWLKTPLPGHRLVQLPAHDRARRPEGRGPHRGRVRGAPPHPRHGRHVRANLPGFADCYVVDVAPQTGVRQTRMLEGEYVVTKDDVTRPRPLPRQRRPRPRLLHALSRAVAEGRRPAAGRRPALLRRRRRPRRSRARSRPAWRWARPPASRRRWRCLPASAVRDIDVAALQRKLRAQGADPGDQPVGRGPRAGDALNEP